MGDYLIYFIIVILGISACYFYSQAKQCLKDQCKAEDKVENLQVHLSNLNKELGTAILTSANRHNIIINLNAEIKAVFNDYSALKSKYENQVTIINSLRKKERHHRHLINKLQQGSNNATDNKRKVSDCSEVTGSQN